MQENRVKLLSDREHVLRRPARYVGSVKNEKKAQWVLDDDGKFNFLETDYNPGFKKIFREIIDNSIDEALRTGFKFANRLKVTINKKNKEFVIEDNGRGIPYEEIKVGRKTISSVELSFTHLKAGSNFEDAEDNTTIGQNGEGSSLTNILSDLFIAESCDGVKKTVVNCKNNMSEIKTKITKGTKKYTRVTYRPTLSFFGLTEIPDFFIKSLRTDFATLTQVYSKLIIELTIIDENGKKHQENLKSEKFNTFMDRFITEEMLSEGGRASSYYVSDEVKGLKVGVFANSTSEQLVFHSINGLTVLRGTPLNWVQNSMAKPLLDALGKKYKSIKSGDVKQKLSFVVLFEGMTNPRFNTQTKEDCINTYTEFKDSIGDLDFKKFAAKVYRNKDIIKPLVDADKYNDFLEDKKALKDLKPENKRVFIEKYYKSSGKLDKASLVLTEGDSALNGVMSVLGRSEYSFFPLKGKPLNVREKTNVQITKNVEIKSILQILNLDITKDNGSINHDSIIIATDADADGSHISGLLLNIFERFAPHLITQGKIKLFRTPMVVATPKSGKGKKVLIYNFEELFEFEKKYDATKYRQDYYKGLGRWEKEDLKKLIKEYGIDNFIIPFVPETPSKLNNLFDNWFNKEETEFRKEQIRNMKFLIEKA